MKYIRGAYNVEVICTVMLCSMCVYTLHVTVYEGCIFMREKENLITCICYTLSREYHIVGNWIIINFNWFFINNQLIFN